MQTLSRTFVTALTMLLTIPVAYGADYAKFFEYANGRGSISTSDATVFPDPQFRAFIDCVDMDKNGALSYEEVKAFSEKGTIDCSGMEIASLAGIEIFEDLKVLNCSNNLLTELDLTYNTHLIQVDCYQNLITGDKMDALIASLPEHEGTLTAVNQRVLSEKNLCTVEQVGAAATRGWTVYDYNGGDGLVAYEGFSEEDHTTGIHAPGTVTPQSTTRYNLMGMPVTKDYRGIVIENGRKIIR
ncbi:MAG: hypothetical protein IJ844_07130 [Prevotella sp.]|nr:hypothetical protein [Prevotella sp.]